jgi:EAL domain-containing protein (putative c-di-GMP-specific phosphodiesterase class I)/FixJ family two-component response regulator
MIDEESRRPSAAGTTVVPTVDAPASSAAVRLNSPPIAFIVEDEPGIRQIICYSLHNYGIQTNEFEAATAALDALKNQLPDLFFLDVSLKGSDAIDVIRGLAQRGYPGTIQLMSGKDPSLLEEIRRVGERHSLRMLAPLRKPFRPEAIRRIVREHLSDHLLPNASKAGPAAIAAKPTQAPKENLDELMRNKQLELWYQPKIDLKHRSLVGVEGLVRGNHPERGIIPPDAFLPGASEETMFKLTETIIVSALADWSRFSEHGFNLKIALNVPVSALVKLPISAIVRDNRPKSDRWPGLILEVTEDQIVRDIPLAHEIATQLKIYDIVLAIDDFGTGYSHLARLRELPFAELKLDRNLVANCGDDATSAALCQTSIDLAHRFGSIAVAEGIEKTSELETLIKMRCDLGQGFLFAPPMPMARFVALLKQRSQPKAKQGGTA